MVRRTSIEPTTTGTTSELVVSNRLFMNITPERLARATAVLQAVEASFVDQRFNVDDDDKEEEAESASHDHHCSKHQKRQRRSKICGLNAGTPNIISKRMELNEWAVSLLFIGHVHPSKELYSLIDEFFVDREENQSVNAWQVVVEPVINVILSRFVNQTNRDRKSQRTIQNSVILQSTSESTSNTMGNVNIVGDITADKQFLKSIVALYYHALEAILYCEQLRQPTDFNSISASNSSNRILSTINKTTIKSFIRQKSFHQALMACCYVAVSKAVKSTQRIRPSKCIYNIPIYSILQSIVQCSSYEFIKVLRFFFIPSLSLHSEGYNRLGSPLLFALPRIVLYELQQIEVNSIDSLVWACNSPLASVDTLTNQIRCLQEESRAATRHFKNVIIHSMPCCWPPKSLAPILPEEVEDAKGSTTISYDEGDDGKVNVDNDSNSITAPHNQHVSIDPTHDHSKHFEYLVVDNIIETMLALARERIVKLCKEMQIIARSSHDELIMVIPQQMYTVFRYLVRNHIYLFHDRHVDHWILCTLYGVTRSIKYQPELKFAQIISAYISVRECELGPTTCQRIIRHIKVVHTAEEPYTTVPTSNDAQRGMGNIISLYNSVFVPTVKEYLLNSHSLRMCTIKLAQLS